MLIQMVWDFFFLSRSCNLKYPFKLKLHCFKPKLHDTCSFFLCTTALSAGCLHGKLVSLHPRGNHGPSHGKRCALAVVVHLVCAFISESYLYVLLLGRGIKVGVFL